jgi:hypothetical protein
VHLLFRLQGTEDRVTYKQTPDWSHVTDKEVSKFWTEVSNLAKRRFGIDVDGDCPIQVLVVNRARQASNNFDTLEHMHKAKGASERLTIIRRNFRTAQANVAMAAEQLRLVAGNLEDALDRDSER